MKTTLTQFSFFGPVLFILMLFPPPAYSNLSNTEFPASEKMQQNQPQAGKTTSAKKTGLFKKIQMLSALKKAMKEQPVEGEKASKLARVALILFISSFVAGSLPVPFLAILGSVAFLTSIVLAFIVLFSEDNRKSKAIAKTILIVSAILVVLGLVFILAILAALT